MDRTPAAAPVPTWHALTPHQVLAALESGEDGLAAPEVARRRAAHGPNELAGHRGVPGWRRFLRQFKSPLIYVLLVAALLSFFMGKGWDPYVILGIVLVNALIGFFQESRAEEALAALRSLTAPQAKVVREAHVLQIPAREVVVGDVLVLEPGDRVPADARILASAELQLGEAALTGESLPVSKSAAVLADPLLPLGDRVNMVYMNTHVTGGRGHAAVVATGMDTEMGAIAEEVASVVSVSPLQRQLASFSRRLGAILLVVIAGVLGMGVARGLAFDEMFMVALSMVVAAIPEGLPIVVSVLLAVGVWRMARRKALVRHLPAVEALGSATVICTDKTGTLTKNEMTVRRVFAGGAWFRVTGEGYAPVGELLPETLGLHPAIERLMMASAALCNDALLEETPEGWRVVGDPTEGALKTLALKAGFTDEWERLAEIPFSSERKWMATLNRQPDGSRVGLVKGALEALLELSADMLRPDGTAGPLEEHDREAFRRAFDTMASEAMRVLAIGVVRQPPESDDFSVPSLARRVTLVGLVGMMDPPRPEAVEAVAISQGAGIRVVMITGDHRETAQAIARHMGILGADGGVLEGPELDRLGLDGLAARVSDVAVFARVSPAHKLHIVRALQAKGHIVSMTGDGVNDAPALAQADIGVAMGRTGTDVAKGAADMVLADDNFATIVAAIEEGRTIASNLRKAIQYLLTTGASEILTVSAAVVLGLPLPLNAVQILWINMVTDGTLDKTFAVEPGDPEVMRRPARPPGAALVSRVMLFQMVFVAAIMAAGTLGLFAWELARGASLAHARTVAFVTLVACQWFSAVTFRSSDRNLWQLRLNKWMLVALGVAIALQLLALYAPFMQQILQTTPLSPAELARSVAIASSVLVVNELRKLVWRLFLGRPHD